MLTKQRSIKLSPSPPKTDTNHLGFRPCRIQQRIETGGSGACVRTIETWAYAQDPIDEAHVVPHIVINEKTYFDFDRNCEPRLPDSGQVVRGYDPRLHPASCATTARHLLD